MDLVWIIRIAGLNNTHMWGEKGEDNELNHKNRETWECKG